MLPVSALRQTPRPGIRWEPVRQKHCDKTSHLHHSKQEKRMRWSAVRGGRKPNDGSKKTTHKEVGWVYRNLLFYKGLFLIKLRCRPIQRHWRYFARSCTGAVQTPNAVFCSIYLWPLKPGTACQFGHQRRASPRRWQDNQSGGSLRMQIDKMASFAQSVHRSGSGERVIKAC